MAVKKPAGLSSPYGQPSWHLQTRDRQASALFKVSSDPADVYETISVVCGTATESAFVRDAIFMTPTGPAGAGVSQDLSIQAVKCDKPSAVAAGTATLIWLIAVPFVAGTAQ